jgi:hypothetical protein
MEELFKKIPIEEVNFLTENENLTKHFYYQLCEIKQKGIEKIVLCENSYQRRLVHILAYALDLYHVRHCEWNDEYKKYFDWQCKCKYCWKEAGEKYFKIIGVKISTTPLKLSNKDYVHQKILKKYNTNKNT